MPTFTETIPVNGQNLGLYLSLPDGDGPFPGIVVGMHAGGTDTFIHATGSRYNEAGDRTSWPRTIEFFDRHLK